MYVIKKFKNGLRVVAHNMKDRQSVSIGIIVGVGGRHESDDIKGAAHFLEHIVFKGSEKYTGEQIKEKIEGVGGALNAFTSEENTCFYAKTPSKHFRKTFDILADMVISPKISKKDFDNEKTVIMEEIKMYKDLPQYLVHELFDSIVWPDHPLGKSLTGSVDNISRMKRSDLSKFHKKYYCPENIVISICGNIDIYAIFAQAEKKFSSCKSNEPASFEPAVNFQESPRVKLFKKRIEQTHLALGCIGYDKEHKDRYTLNVLSVILGGNMSSRLFVEVREKRGLAYSISAHSKNMHDTGVFLIRAGVDNEKIVDAASLILKELKKVSSKGVSKDEFVRGKEYLLGQLLLGLEDTMEHMLWLGDSVISNNKAMTIKEIVKEFDKIKLSDIKKVASDIFNRKRLNLAVVGPLNDVQEESLNKMFS